MSLIDWLIVFVLIASITGFAFWTKRYNKSVADFISANRCGRRYLLAVAELMALLGAISFVADFERYYQAGFAIIFWSFLIYPFSVIMSLTGWIIYRYRETRAMTLGQFFEIRYSHKFRIFAGSLAFFAGVVNFGIYPGIGARFFMYFCGLPQYFTFLGIEVSTFVVIMVLLLSLALLITFWGGQISVMVTDFVQGMLLLIVLMLIIAFFFFKFDMNTIFQAITAKPPGKSMVNPFDTGGQTFNYWIAILTLVQGFYTFLSWQSIQGYNTSAISAHEAKMGRIVGTFRGSVYYLTVVFIAVCAYTAMHHPSYSSLTEQIRTSLASISSPKLRGQMVTPMFLGNNLPVGLLGLFCSVMFCAFISTHDTFLHSWGTLFIQDIVIPLRKNKKLLTPQQHMKWLRLSILGVAVFVFFWSLFLQFEEHIIMYWMITSAIFLGGSGSAIIGGLYWKRGTTVAAYSALIVGSVLAVSGILTRLVISDFPIQGHWMSTITMAVSVGTYIAVSLLGPKNQFNMDRMLHRGKYAIEDDQVKLDSDKKSGLRWWKRMIGLTNEFNKKDTFIYVMVAIYSWIWFVVGIVTIIYYLYCQKKGIPFGAIEWFNFWKGYIYAILVIVVIVCVWFTIGGISDLQFLFKRLSKIKRNEYDDGRVTNHHNLADDKEITCSPSNDDKE